MPRPARRRATVTVVAVVALVCVTILSLSVGARDLSPSEVVGALLWPDDSVEATVVIEKRLPRTLVGLLVGAGLAAAGVIMQALTRNPLADPRIFGVSAGASLGVVVAIAGFGLASLSQYVWFGIAGALAAGLVGFMIAHTVSRGREGSSPVTLALVGTALDASLSAVIYGVLTTSAQSFDQYRFWVVGSLAGRDAAVAWQVSPFLVAGLVVAAVIARGLDALVLGEEMASGLGHRTGIVRFAGAVAVALLTGAAVAAAGPVGFIGLAIPHLVRLLVGHDHRPVLLVSMLLGPVLLLAADVLGRRITAGEMPAGIVTALVGAPVLILLVRRAKAVAV
ncbi:FecCD family ABC transporter permease [Stackebrandtia nassauensis]|uniref:Transport system permease protein n=1 Tax=Stackebrandtia nassauensis (strain DSM 44728 / CIP 108903 / NRRL B-16338 / NBRC 102104 / LLR-40K-21) TaxID=446470 RepID=D3PWG8_STANL|nr:iron ABC transporter permease [Stackebrandtia nassauensis]ADD43190.1 transport system permease protein [Stackebrandtia nassauensis DSM 44728]